MPPPPPLTHHQILALVGPFTASGRQVDLAASDRLARRLQFKPLPRALPGSTQPLTEILQLECHESGNHRLTRVLARPDGQQATLQAMGTDLAAVLTHIDSVPAARQFDAGPGWQVARSHALISSAHGGMPTLTFEVGEARLDGACFTLRVMDVKNVAGDITLQPAPGEQLAFPEDVLAVMGWNWVRLVPAQGGWTSKLRLRGRGQPRTQAAEQALQQAAQHLAGVLAAPPATYHPRHRAARWGVVLRRAIPTLTAVGLVAGALVLPRVTGQQLQGVWMALHYVPIGVLALSFMVQELARFELPMPPRRVRVAQWRTPVAVAPAAGVSNGLTASSLAGG